METWEFTIAVNGTLDDEAASRLYDVVDDDIGVETGPVRNAVTFMREAETFQDAVISALQDLIAAGLEPVRIEEDLVSAAEIATRTNLSRQYISSLVVGRRGSGDFPPPAVIGAAVRSPLWVWGDVARWCFQHDLGKFIPVDERPTSVGALNAALALRVLARHQPSELETVNAVLELGGKPVTGKLKASKRKTPVPA